MVVSAPSPNEGRTNSSQLSKRALSCWRVALLELMQSINFGRIENLRISGGDPVVDPRPVVVREIKFAGENGPRAELAANDFLLKQQVVELFAYLDAMQDGVIDLIEIKHGLPFRMTVTEVAA